MSRVSVCVQGECVCVSRVSVCVQGECVCQGKCVSRVSVCVRVSVCPG